MITMRVNTTGTHNYMEVTILDWEYVMVTIYDDDDNDDTNVSMKVLREDFRHLAKFM